MTQTLVKVELAKALLDGEWHSTPCLTAHAGNLIRPEIAYRADTKTSGLKTRKQPSDEQKIAAGRGKIVRNLLRRWVETGKVERRNQECSQIAEWKLIDRDWFDKFLKGVENGNN